MQPRPMQGLWGKYALFVGLSLGILFLNALVISKLYPEKDRARQNDKKPAIQADQDRQPDQDRPHPEPTPPPPEEQIAEGGQPAQPGPVEQPGGEDQPAQPVPVDEGPPVPLRYATLGSLDRKSPYRMLVTLTNRGAAVPRIELNSPRFSNLEDRSGYLGQLFVDEEAAEAECRVQVVGPGTPAALAGIKPGDLIQAAAGQPVTDLRSFRKALAKTKLGQTVMLKVRRNETDLELKVTLVRRPLEIVRPEKGDPLSFLLTLWRIDDLELPDDTGEKEDQDQGKKRDRYADVPRDESIRRELAGPDGAWQLDLRSGNWVVLGADDDPRKPEDWKVEDGQPVDGHHPPSRVRFGRWLKRWDLTVVKTFDLAKVPRESREDIDYRGYHLVFDVEIFNVGEGPRQVAYQLDGPTGLPTEGSWYANKIGPRWGLHGLRDVAVSFNGNTPSIIQCVKIAGDKLDPPWEGEPLTFIGVDAQYFSTILIPKKKRSEVWFSQSRPLRVGAVDGSLTKTTDTSCRLRSKVRTLEPQGVLAHRYEVFVGPKRPPLLEGYGLKDLVYYGWFWWVAIPMSHILHFFYWILGNYGVAILLLTVMVRGGMTPLSRKQVRGSQKMQELQPELRKITEKYKNDMEGRSKAQKELFDKHDYHPLSGCWVMFLQLPIFIGLYRSLMVDVELRQAPLLWEGVRWCSNLAAPDMLFDWSGFWHGMGWDWFNAGRKMFALGPYFNLLPCITVVLFLAQQAMFMPPAADEKAAMQQKMMKFMMIFMGVMFFKWASGLCLYSIASILWGVAERKLLPQPTPPGAPDKPKPPKSPSEPPPKPSARSPRDRHESPQRPTVMTSLKQALKDIEGASRQDTSKRKKKKGRGKRQKRGSSG